MTRVLGRRAFDVARGLRAAHGTAEAGALTISVINIGNAIKLKYARVYTTPPTRRAIGIGARRKVHSVGNYKRLRGNDTSGGYTVCAARHWYWQRARTARNVDKYKRLRGQRYE
jgi:hypothetical protein